MKKKFLLATAVVAVLSFSSCKKDDADVPTPPVATKRLKKETKTEAGVTTVFNLTYDAANRLTSYKSADNSEYVLFTYDAAGNLVKVDQREKEYKNLYQYTYVNNVPVSGTLKSWEIIPGQADDLIEDDKLTYTVTNNQVSKIKLEMLMANSTINLLLTYAATGNLSMVTTEGIDLFSADFTFGTKKAVYPKVTNYVLDQAGFSLHFASKNELISSTFDFPGTASDETTNITYTYDSNGYVLTSNDGTSQSVYEYQ